MSKCDDPQEKGMFEDIDLKFLAQMCILTSRSSNIPFSPGDNVVIPLFSNRERKRKEAFDWRALTCSLFFRRTFLAPSVMNLGVFWNLI